MEQPDFKHIAAQLRQPTGTVGVETAARMHINNGNMIRSCIDRLPLQAGISVLELGPGGGQHLPYLFEKESNLQYTGADISDTMVAWATEQNSELVASGKAAFCQLNIENGVATLPFANDHFDVMFTVNTLYFWDNAPGQAAELLRVLKPGGSLALCFASDTFMNKLPFTQYGFHLYSGDQAQQLMTQTGFELMNHFTEEETVSSNAGETVTREFMVMLLRKP